MRIIVRLLELGGKRAEILESQRNEGSLSQ